MPESLSLFERMRRPPSFLDAGTAEQKIFFRLGFDDAGAFVEVVNAKGAAVETNHRFYSGPERDVLKTLEFIEEQQSFVIDWEQSGEGFYLADHDVLIWQLRRCPNFVDQKFQPVRFSEKAGKIVVRISGGESLQSRALLLHEGAALDDLQFLSEKFVFAKGEVCEIAAIGENFSHLKHFSTTFPAADLEKYFSLLFSYFENVKVEFEDYAIVSGEPKIAQTALIFEKVDDGDALYMRLTSHLPGFGLDLLDQYDVRKAAAVNEMEKKVVVSGVAHADVLAAVQKISASLDKHRNKLDEISDYILDHNLFIVDEALSKEFIYKELAFLLQNYVVFGAEKLKAYKIRAASPKLNLTLDHGIDFLEGDAALEIEGQSIPLFEALNQFSSHAYIPLNDGTHAVINPAYISRLQRLFKKKKDKIRVSFFDLPIVEEMIDEKVAQASFQRSREVFLGFNDLEKASLKLPELQAELRPYQKQGFKWLRYLHQNSLGGCLADDMGLGKTLQAISMLAEIYPKEKMNSLVVMPRSLLFNWENEIQRFAPQLSCCLYYGQDRDFEQARKNQVILTTYALVRNDIEKLKEIDFYYVILDESQNIKNLNSQISRAVMLLNAKRRMALSGTPIENNLGELYALFRFLNPAMFGSVDDFNRSYATPIQKFNEKDVARELKKKIYPFILRRLKRDVLKDLPEKVEQTLFVEMSKAQKQLYESRRLYFKQFVQDEIERIGLKKSQFILLQALSELRQIASIPEAKSDDKVISPKREMLIQHVEDAVANGHKVLVFANFLSVLEHVGNDLQKSGLDYLTMTGATRDRKTLVESFQNDPQYKVFLMTLKTGGLGLNLTAADTIFIFDPWWNKSAENQAIDRAHRIGQDKTVFAYKLITKGTIEEKMLQLQEQKSALFDEIIASDGASLKSLSERDVEFIFD